MRFGLLMVLLVLVVSLPTAAHRMLIHEDEPGRLRVTFDDGTIGYDVQVVVYGPEDAVVERGTTDSEGVYAISDETAIYAIARDDMGHRARIVLGEEGPREINRTLNASIGVLVILLLGFLAWYAKRRFGAKNAAQG